MFVEQANIFNQATDGIIRAEVASEQDGQTLVHMLLIVAPILDNYRYNVCMVRHGIELYPCSLFDHSVGTWVDCSNERELENRLSTILRSEKTKRIIASLMSQSQA